MANSSLENLLNSNDPITQKLNKSLGLEGFVNSSGYKKAKEQYEKKNGIESSSNDAGNIYMPAPYAVIVEPYEKKAGTNVSGDNHNYAKTKKVYDEAKNKLIDQTEEAATIRSSWTSAPKVTLENGKLILNGSSSFLKSDEAKSLMETIKNMEGSTYTTESLNKQIEAWNSVLAKMSTEYIGALETLNALNEAINKNSAGTTREDTAHRFTFSDLQKIGNSRAVGKQNDAKTTKNKIFVGFEWDDDGNMKEKWVEAKKFYEEFNSMDDDEKRAAYHSLATRANLGDVEAYSKMMYLQGGSDSGPANIEYDPVGDFWHTLGNNILVHLGNAGKFIVDYAPFFNTSTITSNLTDAAEHADERDFWDWTAAFIAPGMYADKYDSRAEIGKSLTGATEELAAAVNWENSYLSEMTPGSTKLATDLGNAIGTPLEIGIDIFASGVGGSIKGAITQNAITKANEALFMTGHFTRYEKVAGRLRAVVDQTGVPLSNNSGVLGGAAKVRAGYDAVASGQFLIPNAIAKNFPNFSKWLADGAIEFQMMRNGASSLLSGKGSDVVQTTETVTTPGAGAKMAGDSLVNNLGYTTSNTTTTVFGNKDLINKIPKMSSETGLSTILNNGTSLTSTLDIRNKALWKNIAAGLNTAFNVVPLVGFSALRNTDEYFARLDAGENVGDMTEFILKNTARDVIIGGGIMGVVGAIGKWRAMGKAAKVSPASAANGTFYQEFGSQEGFYSQDFMNKYASETYRPWGTKRLEPGNLTSKETAELQNTLSSIVTFNNEVITGVAGEGGMTSAIPGSYVEGAARTMGVVGSDKITKFRVEPAVNGAYIVEESVGANGAVTTTKKFVDDIAEAAKEVGKKSIPTSSPKTLANSDDLEGMTVAPFNTGGETTNVMPKGVSQVKIEPGIIYASPDKFVDGIMDVAAAEGWHETNVARIRETYERYVNEVQVEETIGGPGSRYAYPIDAPEYLTNMYDYMPKLDSALRAAAWAKYHKYDLMPIKSPAVTRKTKVLRRNIKAVVNTPSTVYEMPEYDPTNFVYTNEGDRNYITDVKAMWYALGLPPKDVVSLPAREQLMRDILGDEKFNRMMGTAISDIIWRMNLYGRDDSSIFSDLMRRYTTQQPIEELLIRYFYGPSYAVGTQMEYGNPGGAVMGAYEGSALETFRNYHPIKDTMHEKERSLLENLEKAYEKYSPYAREWFDELKIGETIANVGGDFWDARKAIPAETILEIGGFVDEVTRALETATSKAEVDGLEEAVAKGKELKQPIYISARMKDGYATFDPMNLSNREAGYSYLGADISDIPAERRDVYKGDLGALGFLHLPAGTKVGRVTIPKDDGSGLSRTEWVVSLKPGVVFEDGEWYLNKPNGSAYTPSKKEYNPSGYYLPEFHTSPGANRYKKWEKDNLTLNPEVKGIKNFYDVVRPGGEINDLNGELRKKKYAGKIPSDSLLMRANDFITAIDDDIRAYGVGEKDEQTIPAFKVFNYLERLMQGRVMSYGSGNYNSEDTTYAIQGHKELFRRLNKIKEEFENALTPIRDEHYAKLKEEGTYSDLSRYDYDGSFGDDVLVPRSLIQWVEKEVLEAAIKYDKEIPSGVLKDFVDIDTLGRLGTYTVKGGIPMPWLKRGLGVNGHNFFNGSDDVYNPINEWKVGVPVKANSIDFYSINPANPFQPIYQTGHGSDNYVLDLGLTPGVRLFSYADSDKAFYRDDTMWHRGDGGAATLAYGTNITPVSIIKEPNGPTHVIAIATPEGVEYDGPLDMESYNEFKRISAREDEIVEIPNDIGGFEYGIPTRWFSDEGEAMAWKSEQQGRAIHRISDSADALDRPPVTTQELEENPLMLGPGQVNSARAAEALARVDELLATLPTLADSPIDYTRGIIDVVRQVKEIYANVALDINLDEIYKNYGQSIADGEEPAVSIFEEDALRPLLDVLDKLGHYFDPSGKSLTKDFYLPTAPKARKTVSLEDLILDNDKEIDVESPADTGFDEILVDPLRIGDTGFWSKRTGELFRDSDGNFTMAKSGTLEDNVIAYTISALTRGKHKLTIAVQNEVAKAKWDKNRSPITSKQAYAGLKDADKIRTTARGFQAKISKDMDALEEIKEDYTGDTAALDEVLKKKDYAGQLNYTNSLNVAAQKLGYNQFMQMNPIAGSALRFGSNTNPLWTRGISNIRRKMEKINVTGTMWVERYGEMVNVGFGLNADAPTQKIYGDFRPEPAVNLGALINLHFDADRAAMLFLNQLNEKIAGWAAGEGTDYMTEISSFVRTNFPLIPYVDKTTAALVKKIAQNYNKYTNQNDAFIANASDISDWIRRNTLTCFNNAIKMSNISNLDQRTINALDEAAAYMTIGTPVYRGKTISALQTAAVHAALDLNATVTIGNALNEPLRLIDVVGYKGFANAWRIAMNPKEAARINGLLEDLPSRFSDAEMVGLANKAKGTLGKFKQKAESVLLSPLEKSEQFKNVLFWAAAEENAKAKYPGDPDKQLRETLRFFNDYAIAGGKGTTPGVAVSPKGRLLSIFRTFTLRNFDDFIDFVEKVARGESGNNYWDEKWEKRNGGKNGSGPKKDKTGRNKFDFKLAAKAVGGRLIRSYLFWLTIGSYLGKNFLDAIGGDPTGVTDGGRDRGLYDDPDTDEYEGMTGFDEFINNIPAGFILGTLQDLYFAARRRGVESKQFLGFDLANDQRFTKELSKKLPLGVAYNRFADMLNLLDRGYSFSSTGRKTYAAPETALDVAKGFLFGKATTENSLAYGKYRYGTMNVWGDLSSGDWMDFAINANPISNIIGASASFDTTRKDYTGVFNGSYNDIATMQLIITEFRKRCNDIKSEYIEDKGRYSGEWQDLNDDEKKKKAQEIREKKIEAYTQDVQRAVNEFTKAGNTLSDKQITTMMYLFDFDEGDEYDEYDSTMARKRYVEADLPDYSAGAATRVDVEKTDENGVKTTEEKTQNILDRSLILKNAQQGFYGSSKEAANAVKAALTDFKQTYKSYNERVKALNDKYFTARKKNKKSAETKQLSKDIEKLQNEYLDKLYAKLSPVVEKYGTALIGSYDVADVLEEYMGNMIPYSSIKKYGQTYSSGNDVVYGQLAEWLQKRWGRNSPTAPSDAEITDGITNINKLLDEGKTSSAVAKAKTLLEKIGRGSLGARKEDVERLRDVAYGR